MSGNLNEDRDSSSPFKSELEPISLGALPSGRSVDLAASNQEGRGDHRSADTPPRPGKLTLYRLLYMAAILSVGTTKGILSYQGKSIAPTTLDWFMGTALVVVPPRLQGHTLSTCAKKNSQRNGNGSSKLIWRL